MHGQPTSDLPVYVTPVAASYRNKLYIYLSTMKMKGDRRS
jgi:hypothetical protein